MKKIISWLLNIVIKYCKGHSLFIEDLDIDKDGYDVINRNRLKIEPIILSDVHNIVRLTSTYCPPYIDPAFSKIEYSMDDVKAHLYSDLIKFMMDNNVGYIERSTKLINEGYQFRLRVDVLAD